jgi:glycosyltransferase involved in cell wall biosynthesis
MLTILSVAYSLGAVRPDTSGGAEQVLGAIDRALARQGHQSLVVAVNGSEVAGTLIATPARRGALDEKALRQAQAAHREAIAFALASWSVDLVPLHGQDFSTYLPPSDVPALVTLHVPWQWYTAFPPRRPTLHYNCVSEFQRRFWPARLDASVVENGVAVERLRTGVRRRRFALTLGRIAPEKGTHLALEAAAEANMPLLVAGDLYAYPEHERYFREQVAPRLRIARARLLGPVGWERKRRLLAGARCLLVASQAPETSSLVAMEALACGTPVIAYPAGALSQIVEHGRTGFLVHSPEEMADAIGEAEHIEAAACRAVARERFSEERMTRQYLDLYERLALREARPAA